MFRSALVVFAHPDDAEFGIAGTVAKWIAEGTEVHYCCITDGSGGNNEPGATREETARVRETEQRAACASLGVSSVTFLGYTDGELELTLGLRRDLTRVVRQIRPEILVGQDPSRLWAGQVYINHIDHRVAGEAVLAAVMPDAPSRPQFPELLDEGLEPYSIPNLWLWGEKGDTHIDIGGTIGAKLQALACHASQDHDGHAAELVDVRARHFGARIDVEYAECFRTFHFD